MLKFHVIATLLGLALSVSAAYTIHHALVALFARIAI